MNDDTLWERFHARTLTDREWTHQAHLRVAWMFLARYPIDVAHVLMRVGIIRLNLAHGLEETAQRGYHETLTRVWLAIVADERARSSAATSEAFIAEAAGVLGRESPLRFYSKARINSVEARAMFVAPDLAPLPADS
jgi:hypothetical protein